MTAAAGMPRPCPRASGAGQPVLSVCLASWNTRELLLACVASLLADPDSEAWEIIVVDNASTDGSAAAVARQFPQVRLQRNAHNAGFAAANNQAMQMARGRYFLLLNTDTQVQRGALAGLVELMERRPDVGAVGPRLIDGHGRLQLSCGPQPSLRRVALTKLLLHGLFPVHRFGRRGHAMSRDVGWISGACMMVRRQTVETAGPLDAALFMFHEDVEWCMRIHQAGWRVVYHPGSIVVHLGGQSVRQDLGRMLVISQHSQFYLFQKHFGLQAVEVLRWLTAAEMLLRAAVWLPLTLLSPRHRAEGRQRLQAYRRILARLLGDRSFWAPLCSRSLPSR